GPHPRGDRGGGEGGRRGPELADQRRRSRAARQGLPRRSRLLHQQGRGAGMTGSPVAKRYANALFELAHEAKAVEPIGKGLADFAQTWKGSEELRRVIESPQFAVEDKKKLVATLAE